MINGVGALFIYRWIEYQQKFSREKCAIKSLVGEYNNIKPGDIILFTGSITLLWNALLTACYYTHVGIVYEKDGELWITEVSKEGSFICNDSKSMKPVFTRDGLNNFPLLSRLKNYRGIFYLMRLQSPLTDGQIVDLKQIIKSSSSLKYVTVTGGTLAYIGLKSIADINHCFLYASDILDGLGLCPQNMVSLRSKGIFGSCNVISELYKYKLKNGNSYDEPIRLTYDISSGISEDLPSDLPSGSPSDSPSDSHSDSPSDLPSN